MELQTVLPVIWFGVIGFGVLMYVVLDGFVLGLGILAPFAEDEAQLDHMMNTAAPIWDGNETWLVLGGTGLLAAFPKAYALVLSALYLPVLLMLIALIFRGVAFEFRFKARRGKPAWGAAFALGSMFAAFAQGVILGSLVEGMPLQEGKYVGGAFDWFSPFSMLTGVAVVFGYALLGACWLILKTDGRMQQVARGLTRPLVFVVVAFMGLVSAWLPFLGIWPNIVPPALTIWEAASPPSSQMFVLAGLVVLLPLILGYTWWSYRVFRGKVEADSGYH